MSNPMRLTTPLPADSGALRLLTMAELARELRCSRNYVYRVIGGKVPSLPPLPILRIGRRVLIRHAALLRWMIWLENRELERQRASGRFSVSA
jgi:excisionase family DNA binding protein